MRTASIFVKKKLDKNTDHFLDNSQIHYLKKVLKLKKDENVHVQDGEGNRCICIYDGNASLKIIDIETRKRNFQITLLAPLLKKNQLEFMLQKSVEIGVKNIYLYIAEKSKHSFNYEKEKKRMDRYEDIIKSAFLQSENFYLPNLSVVRSIADFNFNTFEKIIVLDQFSKTLLNKKEPCDLLVSGGEYGFDDTEIKIISKNRASSLNLGENILRAETAPLVALSRLNF
jgi:16S rRNA (uracil1498-N3)-methyltransferase